MSKEISKNFQIISNIVTSELLNLFLVICAIILIIKSLTAENDNFSLNTNWFFYILIFLMIVELWKYKKTKPIVLDERGLKKLFIQSIVVSFVISVVLFFAISRWQSLAIIISLLSFFILIIFNYLFIYDK